MQHLAKTVHRAKLRLRVNLFLRELVRALLAVAILLPIPAAAIKLWNLAWPPHHLLFLLLLALPWALVRVLLCKITDTSASVEVDRRFRLDERVSSAWVLAKAKGPMIGLLETDAEAHARRLDLSTRFPVVAPRGTVWLGIPLATFAAVCLWLPPLPSSGDPVIAAVPKSEKPLEKEKLERVAQILQPKPPDPQQTQEPEAATMEHPIAAQVTELGKRLQREKMTEKEALAALSSQQDEIRRKKEKLARAEEAQSRLQKPHGSQRFTEKVREEAAQGEYGKAAESLSELGQQVSSGNLSKADVNQLKEELEALSKSLEGNPDLQAALKEASAALSEIKAGQEGGLQLSEEQRKKLEQALAKAGSEFKDLQSLSSSKEMLETLLSDIDLAKLELSDGLKQCSSCGKICSASEGCSACQGKGAGLGLAGTLGGGAGGAGQGMGGPGQGKGGAANRYQEPEVVLQDENISTPWHEGKPLGVLEVEAQDSPAVSTLGESVAILEAGEAEQSVVHEDIPPGYEDLIRGYFDRSE